jgi:hypothetical protein
MNCTKKGQKSIFGEVPKIVYNYADIVKKGLKRKYDVLLIDCVDGLCLMPFVRQNLKVYGYEVNQTYLYGGILNFNMGKEKEEIIGLKNRLANEKISDNVSYYNKNYYLEKLEYAYDFVFVYKSLHRNHNKDILMKEKINKILTSVANNGYVFIYYYLAVNESDYNKYPANQYLRAYEMTKYFNNEWKIINCNEYNKIKKIDLDYDSLENNRYRKGIIFAKKTIVPKHKQNYQYHFKITSCKHE